MALECITYTFILSRNMITPAESSHIPQRYCPVLHAIPEGSGGRESWLGHVKVTYNVQFNLLLVNTNR